jgi:hypothetical protein
MRKDDRGLVPHGGILVDDAADRAATGAEPGQPGQSRASAPDQPAAPGQPAAPDSPPAGGAEPAAPGPVADGTGTPGAGQPQPGGERAQAAAAPADGTPPASVAARPSGIVARPTVDTAEPSWGRVLATTISLWVSRRLRRIGLVRAPKRGTGRPHGEQAARGKPRSGWRWPLVALVLALAVVGLVALQLSGALSTSGSAGRGSGTTGTSSLSAAATARNQAAAWAAQQVSSGDIIACDPAMCSALQARGLPAGRLLPLQPAGADPFGADVIVASPSVRNEFGSQLTEVFAPALIATFGSGATRVDIRAIASLGGAAYRAAEPADLAARKAAGAQLLHNQRFHASAQAARQITAGQVDSRVLVSLAALVSQRPVSVTSFGDTGPGVAPSFRQVTIARAGGQVTDLTADLSQVQAQRTPYLPASATIVHLGGRTVLRIEFGAPSLQGLLSGANSS